MENKYLHFTFSDGVNTLNMGCGETIKIVSFKGLESPLYTIHTSSNATQDGLITTGKKVNERIIDVVFGIDDVKEPSFYRRKIETFFNGKKRFTLKVAYIYNNAIIDFEVQEFYWTPAVTLWDTIEGNLVLMCPYPYWSDLDNFGKNIAAISSQFTFPLAIISFYGKGKSRPGKIMGYNALSKEVNLHNKGDVETGIEIRFVAKRGRIKNPKVTKLKTGEFIEIIIDMQMGDEIIVNTNAGKKSITKNGVNIFKEKNKLSSFFQLAISDNKISYDALENYTNLDVKIFYTPKYLGV